MTSSHRRLSAMSANYPASSIRKMFALAGQRPNSVKLTVGEPDFTTPEHIKQAGIRAIENDETRYVPNAGLPELRSAIAAKYSRRWERMLQDENVMVTFGGMEALAFALDVTVERGDEVIVADPGYPNYIGQIHRAGATLVTVPVGEENGFKLRAEDLAAAVTDRTAAVILNSPSNPLGSIIDRGDLVRIADLADERGFMIISDEVYDEIVFEGATFTSIAQIRPDFDRFLVVNSLSKTYAMTGWRCGFVIGPKDLIAPMPILQEGLASGVPAFVQRAAIAALDGPQDAVHRMVDSYRERRELIVERMSAIDGVHLLTPEATFYAFVNISEYGVPSWDLAIDLLEKHGLAAVPGSAFGPGGEGYLRITFAVAPETIEDACARLADYAGRR